MACRGIAGGEATHSETRRDIAMARRDPLKDIELLIRSRHGVVVIDTDEEERAATLLQHLADSMEMPLFTWSRTRGLRRAGNDGAGIYGTDDPKQALAHIHASPVAGIYHMQGFTSLLADEGLQDRIKEIAQQFLTRDAALVFTCESLA